MSVYPIGQQDFKGVIEGGYKYADKTSFIIRLLEEKGKYYFLGRPRRFGKSLFLSTLEYFFLGEKSLFKGLAIDSYDWDWKSYPVVHLDLNGTVYSESSSSLSATLTDQMEIAARKYGVSAPSNENLEISFRTLLHNLFEKTGSPVVVLVDEYEKPVLDTIDNPELRELYRERLRGFYSVLKSCDKYLRLVFLTGVTKFGKMNVFSALNNIHDISLEDRYAAICGITREELLGEFHAGVEAIASAEGVDFDESLRQLKENYDGYHFSARCPDIYNPYSLLTAFRNGEIGAYWSETGTPSILARMLVSRNYDLEKLNGAKATREMLMDVGGDFDEPLPMFYQTGYLTIKDYNPVLKIYLLGFPNREVETAFFNFIIPYYLRSRREAAGSYIMDFAEGIIGGEPEKAVRALMDFSATINYELVPKVEVERHFQQMMYVFSRLLLPYATSVKAEEHTSDGRIDLLISTSEYVYVFELKKDVGSEEALQQILDKDYTSALRKDGRKVYLIGLNFSTERRRLDAFSIAVAPGAR